MILLLPILGAYLIGSIPTGYWLGRLIRGIDIRTMGSGNLGATNVFRVLGWKAGAVTLIIDIVKGYLAVIVALNLLPRFVANAMLDPAPSFEWVVPSYNASNPLLWTAGICAILGHSFSIFVRFRGGKGVATAAGVFIALLPLEASIALGTFLVVFLISRIVSLSSMVGAVALAVSTLAITRNFHQTALTSAVAGFVIWRHRANIQRLMNGTEARLSFSKKGSAS